MSGVDLCDLHAEVLHACFENHNRGDDARALLAPGKPPRTIPSP
jgi:hypothetical protein